ncbi:hypothetical protein CHS0354_016083 [Potamilus streckersoni]|uniref:Uncharacterized protein n=1 Tax=Potamilus streckersoni TaxID=2493646 RepID=A0AAE0W4G7_9BIVA|nr:hypothetical protein CHS0354_016083 [Potamilus streckersoni]
MKEKNKKKEGEKYDKDAKLTVKYIYHMRQKFLFSLDESRCARFSGTTSFSTFTIFRVRTQAWVLLTDVTFHFRYRPIRLSKKTHCEGEKNVKRIPLR